MTSAIPAKNVVRLDQWVGTYGPLSAADALVIALHVCATASHLTRSRLAAVVDSLNAASITRQPPQGWLWVPATVPSAGHTVGDGEVVARVGAILFHALTGHAAVFRFDSERALRTTLRTVRPDLPANVVDLVARALTASRTSDASLTSFARDLRHALGLDSHSFPRAARRPFRTVIGAGAALTASLMFLWTYTAVGRDRRELHGLTADETSAIEFAAEAAQTMALIDEHTAAIQTYQQMAKLWGTRIGMDDPRLAWNQMHEAWVRTLAGDRLTAEQLLEKMPSELTRWLGQSHPYTRAARLELADTLEARGAKAEAASLRSQAELATRALFKEAVHQSVEFDSAPVSTGVFAHVYPNNPVHEGFRGGAGGFFVPLTSAERWIAGRDGWTLHVVATGTCRASLVVGTAPRSIAANMFRSADGSWNLRVDGSKPATTIDGGKGAVLAATIAGDATGPLKVTLGSDTMRTLAVDPSGSPAAIPPYSLAFSDASNCAVVWLEIPFPVQSTFRRADKTSPQ